ncbi:hypothetical protein BCR36DRAFT_580469 [Piromyces finnis]|uniref:Dilute domain-containing protein n=1 Tax=Piromyces finnis TaxID=1754191 RepID=A0A1Y1VKL5_9FUNG|nr:hypothetical protein BCR36DRAFT_580469 [Piromyces finnis]|eukprot:ORX57907.1 hypothetical protein BCR36DRAFT_580469 [Piromyces finnis]
MEFSQEKNSSLHSLRKMSSQILEDVIQIQEEDKKSRENLKTLQSPTATSETSYIFEDEILEDPILLNRQKREKMFKLFMWAASNGDFDKLRELLENEEKRKWIDINGKDESGCTALIYTACFAHAKCAYLLLKHGADVDATDKFGWTALVWASNNHHDELVRIMLAGGADCDIKLSTGKTVKDYAMHLPDNDKLLRILSNPPTPFNPEYSFDNGEPLFDFDPLFNYKLSNTALSEIDSLEEEIGDDFFMPFSWDKCDGDQMFVFDEAQLDTLCDYIVLCIQPIKKPEKIYTPANIILLSARYAYYYNSTELLKKFFDTIIKKVGFLLKKLQQKPDVNIYIFWLTNLLQLLCYLKKDTELVVSTVEYQYEISELVNEFFINLIQHLEERLEDVIEPSLMQYNTIPGIDEIKFESSFSRLGRRMGFKASLEKGNSRLPKKSTKLSGSRLAQFSPQTVINILSSILRVLRTYRVHTSVIQQIIQQLLYFINCEIFNRLLTDSDYCCRSKAMQIRLNISNIEDWIRETIQYISDLDSKEIEDVEEGHQYFINNQFMRQLAPSIKLCQLLQVCTSFTDLESFFDIAETIVKDELASAIASNDGCTTITNADSGNANLSMAQMRIVFDLYHYEVNEPKINHDIIKYINRQIKRIKEEEKNGINDSTGTLSSFNSLSLNELTETQSQASSIYGLYSKRLGEDDDDTHTIASSTVSTAFDCEDPLMELLDSKLILPFGVPVWRDADRSFICRNTPYLSKETVDEIDHMCREKDRILKEELNLLEENTTPIKLTFSNTPMNKGKSVTNDNDNNHLHPKSGNSSTNPRSTISPSRSKSPLATSPPSTPYSNNTTNPGSGRSSPYTRKPQVLPPLPPLTNKNRPVLPPLPPLTNKRSTNFPNN